MPPLMTEDRILEWVKVLGPFVCSWPLVVLAIVITFRKTIADVVIRVARRGIRAKIGSNELEILEATKATAVMTAKQSEGTEQPPIVGVFPTVIERLRPGVCRYLLTVSGVGFPPEEHVKLLAKNDPIRPLLLDADPIRIQVENLIDTGHWSGTITSLSGLMFSKSTLEGGVFCFKVFPDALPLLAKQLDVAPPSNPPLTVTGPDTAGADGRPDAPSGRRP